MLRSILHHKVVRNLYVVESQEKFYKQVKRPYQIFFSTRSSHDVENANESSNKPRNNYQMIYKFPYIVQCRTVSRIKIYQTAITSIAVPVVGYLTHVGTVDFQGFLATLSIGTLATVMLYVMGEFFRRLVGIIYYNPSESSVKISHLSFWGNRKEVYVPLDDIVPLTDTDDNPTDVYVKLLRYSKPKSKLYMSLRFGEIVDSEKFVEVFGHLKPEEQLQE